MPDYRELLTAFRDETELSEAGAARLRRRLAEPEPRPRRGLVLAMGGVAIAALVVLALRPVPVGGPLQSGALTHEVSLVVDGAGQVSGHIAGRVGQGEGVRGLGQQGVCGRVCVLKGADPSQAAGGAPRQARALLSG